MCRVLNVARVGFCACLHNPVSARDKDNQRLLALIRVSYSLSGGVYGYRRVHGDLSEIGETCGKNRVGRIMQLNRIEAVRGDKAPRRIAGRPSVVAPNRTQREFTVVKPNQVWVTDITYIRTWQGWLYLAVVIDLFTRDVVGCSMNPTLSLELALDALMMAVWRRKPDRSKRRLEGKSDPLDAENAARTAPSGSSKAIPNMQSGACEAHRNISIARRPHAGD